MKALLVSFVTILSLSLPIGLCTELISRYGSDVLARTASFKLRGQYPDRLQLANELTNDGQIAPSLIDEWEWQALQSLQEPLSVALPYAEQWLLQEPETQVITFDVSATQGRVLEILSQRRPTAQGGVIVEIFQLVGERHHVVASSAPNDTELRWPVNRTGTYRIRVQSIPGSLGTFSLTLDVRHAFDFPVATDSPNPVRSLFGVPRDAGRRQHRGIDIFAPRHTPVLAASDGYIHRVSTSPRGGLHIWQRGSDDFGNPLGSLYYAHLQDTHVTAGTWVTRGTQIGTVGNSGNAISTPPHLHFGYYQRAIGPIDPLPYTGSARQAKLNVSSGHQWPVWVAVARETVNVRQGPGLEYAIEATVSEGELVSVQAASNGWLRIKTGSGMSGFLASSTIEVPVRRPLTVSHSMSLQASSKPSSPVLIDLESGTVVSALGRFGNARLVTTNTGLQGWIIDVNKDASKEPAS